MSEKILPAPDGPFLYAEFTMIINFFGNFFLVGEKNPFYKKVIDRFDEDDINMKWNILNISTFPSVVKNSSVYKVNNSSNSDQTTLTTIETSSTTTTSLSTSLTKIDIFFGREKDYEKEFHSFFTFFNFLKEDCGFDKLAKTQFKIDFEFQWFKMIDFIITGQHYFSASTQTFDYF